MDFEWDEAKADSNERKQGVTFSEAMTVFGDSFSIPAFDPKHADDEDRFLTLGTSVDGRHYRVPHGRPGVRERITRMATSPEAQESNDDLEPECDFRSLKGVVRGKYAARYQEKLRVVRLEPDISAAFSDEASVNAALREYLTWRQDHPSANPV